MVYSEAMVRRKAATMYRLINCGVNPVCLGFDEIDARKVVCVDGNDREVFPSAPIDLRTVRQCRAVYDISWRQRLTRLVSGR